MAKRRKISDQKTWARDLVRAYKESTSGSGKQEGGGSRETKEPKGGGGFAKNLRGKNRG